MNIRNELKWVLVLGIVCFAVYANSLSGEFVYDDTRQIVRNPLIQDNALVGQALSSDVWAFKGDGTVVTSNYWRPTFTAWHILNYRLFGGVPTGWHALNILLHFGVCFLIFVLLRKLELSTAVSFAIALIFAVHPVHVESVSWISGVPDLLFALAFLGSLLFAHTYAESRKSLHLLLMTLLYAVALGAKEIGVICLPIYYFVLTRETSNKKPLDFKTPLLILGCVSVVWFFLRMAVLGGFSIPPEDAVGLGPALLSIPSMFAFYLRQAFFPIWLSGNYPVEPVASIGLTNFVIPLAVAAAALAGIGYLFKNEPKTRLAAAIFLLPLAPAMNAMVFTPEQIVHDRYLYLPLLGLLMLVVPLVARLTSERNVVIGCVAVSVLLSIQTVVYNRTWQDELSLWANARSYDGSAFTTGQYANALIQAGRYDDAIREYTDSIAKKPRARSYLGRGGAFLKKKQYQAAESDLKAVLQFPLDKIDVYAMFQAYESLGMAYSEQKNYEAAINNFVDARSKLPLYNASLTCDLAVVLYQAGQKERALRELEAVVPQARKELMPEAKAVFMRLGMLYSEMGRKDEARAALREHLTLTAAFKDKESLNDRQMSARFLEGLK